MGKHFRTTGSRVGYSVTTSSGVSEGKSRTMNSSEGQTESYDPAAIRGTRIFLKRALRELERCLKVAEEVRPSDLGWFMDRARELFKNAVTRGMDG